MATDPRFKTQQWKRLRQWMINRNNGTCDACGKLMVSTEIQVDHITPVVQGGGFYEVDNLRVICAACNASKATADKQGKQWIRKGCNPDGTPVDPKHWWNKEKK